MALLNNAALYYESAQSQKNFAAMAADSARQKFSLANKPWSQMGSYAYVIAPYGLATGGAITPAASAANDQVDVAALTAYMAGATGASATTGLLSVSAATNQACTRGAGASTAYLINSITVNSSGAIAVVAGTGSTAHSETRGAAGGPPLIPDGSIEIGQVRFTSHTSAAVTAGEISQIVGTSQERWDYPVWSADPLAGTITFADALPASHTGAIAKRVYARVATPIFAPISRARNWVPAEETNSTSSQQYYDGAIGTVSASLGQASFESSLGDGVTDSLLALAGQNILIKFLPDKNKSAYQLTQGVLGVSRTFAVGAQPSGNFTLSPTQKSVDFAS